MDQSLMNELKKVTALLKKGDAVTARSILVEMLKKDPDIEQAWYMLSFATNSSERQVYALRQVLRIDPKNEKAANRLKKITGELTYQSEEYVKETDKASNGEASTFEEEKTKSQIEEDIDRPIWEEEAEEKEDELKPMPATPAREEADLLSRRLFDSGSEEDIESRTEELENFEQSKTKQFSREKKQTKTDTFIVQEQNNKPNQLRRILMSVLIILLIIVNILLVTGKLAPLGQEKNVNISQVYTSTLTQEEAAAVGGGEEETLSLTMTPISTIKEATNTSVMVETDQALEIKQIPTPSALSEEVQKSVVPVQKRVASILGIVDAPEVPSELTSKARIQQITELSIVSSKFTDKVAKDTIVYNVLGLADSNYSMRSHYLNIWVEAEGGVYSPNNDSVYISGFGFGKDESSKYAFEYTQALIDFQYNLIGMGIFPVCQFSAQYCDVIMALVKGQAALVTEQYGKGQEAGSVFYFDAFAPPAFAQPDLFFPYEKGKEFVKAVYTSGGWEAVNAAYNDPPLTTEQIIHPEKYLERENQIDVEDLPLSMALDENWEEIINDNFGEWKTFLVMAYNKNPTFSIDEDISRKAAEGWGGDQIQIYKNKITSQTVLSLHWIWDTQNDKTEFEDALKIKLTLEYNDPEENSSGLLCWSGAQINCIHGTDDEVIWIAAPNIELIIELFELFNS